MPTGADLLIQGLLQAGTRRVFFSPDGGSVPALLASAHAYGLPSVPVHSETAACVMAAVSGELGGAPGAAIVGAGAPDVARGLAHARRDRAPVILISGGRPSTPDDRALYALLAKQSLTVSADSAARRIAGAARLSMTEPRGPVHLDLPPDVAGAPALPVAETPRPPALPPPDPASLDAAAAMIEAASRPLVVAGLGCRPEDAVWIRAFAEALPAPVLTTVKAKGTMPEPHPLSLGVFAGGPLEEPVVRQADAIIAIGLDAAELPPRRWLYPARVLHVGRAPHVGRLYRAAVEVVGEPALVLEELAPRLQGRARADWDVAELDRMKRAQAARVTGGGPGAWAETVARIAREVTEAGTIAAIDGGAGMLPVALGWQAVAPGECLAPNRLATPGFALPAAIAAQLVHPERRVLAFMTLEGLMRVIAELETAARLGLPILLVLLSAAVSGELPAVARGFGFSTHEATDARTARQALVAALAANGPALVAARAAAPGGCQTGAGRATMSVPWRS